MAKESEIGRLRKDILREIGHTNSERLLRELTARDADRLASRILTGTESFDYVLAQHDAAKARRASTARSAHDAQEPNRPSPHS
jgi:hypothetical protein